MNRNYQYTTINNPNLEIPKQETATRPFGYYLNVKGEGEHPVTEVKVKDMYLPNFSVRISEGELNQEAVFVNTSAEGLDMFGTCLFLKGNVKTSVNKHHDGIASFNGSQNFKYDPNNIFIHTTPAHAPFHIAHVSVKPGYLFQFLPENERWSDLLRKKVQNGESFIGDRYTPITLLQERALQNVFNCPLTGSLGQLMIETSLVQIILIQLHAIYYSKDILSAEAGTRDIEVVQGLKEHLNKTFLEEHSLENLAREFGVNTSKLMALFKKVFNKSIFEYLMELRMEYARELLQEKDYLVTEVARTLGYKNPNHFSAAFKKRFGFCPSKVR
jgi:AraC family transcriptional regulator, transcriptional activator of the genes for pyochelin and ferripyochelin receptors